MTYDGPSVFRAPYGNDAALENFQRTVIDGVSTDRIGRFTDRSFEEEKVRLWGTKASVEGSWESVDAGDFLIFYRDGQYEYAAEVLGTERNEELGKEIWPNYEDGAPWVCIIYLDEAVEIDVPSAEVHDLAGYDIDYPMGFAPLNEMGVGGLRGRYGSVEEFVYGEEGSADVDVTAQPEAQVSDEIFDGLYFPDEMQTEIREQINDALGAGKHVILTGPPGTGKTEIAQRVCATLARDHSDVFTGHQTTTATADWSTFETVGGYMPEEQGDGSLNFEPGQILKCFKQGGGQRNDLLVVDEINRSDIDKSFGQLFTLLSGQSVQLPFTRDGEQIEILPGNQADGSLESHEYVMPDSWRIFATMNSYDKTSLYEMSYAFMRRFAFVYVDAPTVPTDDVERRAFVSNYADAWGIDASDATLDALGDVWRVTNTTARVRKMGPAILRDMLSHVAGTPDSHLDDAVTRAISSYLFPQLEGVRKRERVVSELVALDVVESERLHDLASDVLGVTLDETA
jgi:MoxR-like ATPase